MEKAQIKAAGRSPGRVRKVASPERGTGEAPIEHDEEEQPRPTNVTDALSGEREVTLRGRAYRLSPLDFNDLIVVEDFWPADDEKTAPIEAFLLALNANSLRAIRFFFWVMIRKTEPTISIQEVGGLLPANLLELQGLIVHLTESSGLSDDEGNGTGIETEAVPSTGR